MKRYDLPERLRAVIGDAIRPGGLALTERAARFCGFSKGARIVDIGCGFGATLDHLREHHDLRVCGIDISARLSKSRGLPVIRASADCLPFGDEVFDGLFCECVLSLLPLPENALREFHRILQPGGYLILSDIYLRSPGALAPETAGQPSCISGATAQSVRIAQAKDCGFELLQWEDHSGYLTEMAASIVWTLGSRDALMKLFFPGACSVCDREVIQRARPGYFLLIARKKG